MKGSVFAIALALVGPTACPLLIPAAQAAGARDPFAGITESTSTPEETSGSWAQRFFTDNFGFRKEIMSEFAASEQAPAYSRQSVGFEALKKFSSETATIASINFQGRLVRRDRFVPVLNDMEGASRPGWWFEYHNAYLDLYNVLDPVLSDERQAEDVGRFNLRAGRFYVPFGLNLQTDTHATILQLSNERDFGFERDWYTGFWGAVNRDLNYDACYLAGSGYDLKYRGQSGLGAARLSLSNKYGYDYGLEGGLSVLEGERLSPEAAQRDPRAAARAGPSSVVQTRRVGIDGRYRQPVPTGLLTLSSELSGGRDVPDAVFAQLYQVEYLHNSRRWGLATQYRRFWQDGPGVDSSIIGEATWYFRNDVGNSNLDWIKVNVERKLEQIQARQDAIVALQYYRYW
jgi:hypothetical protein